ncbi:MAG: FAD:protein FMN transferase [Terriglobales bacterium]
MKLIRRTPTSTLVIIILACAVVLCSPLFSYAAAEQMFSQSHQAMGTVFTVYLYANDSEHASASFEMAFEEIDRLDETLSNYRTASELSQINHTAARETVTTDPEVFGLLQRSMEYSRWSNGAFDITVGPLMRAWGFFRGEGHYPSSAELAKARKSVGWKNVVLNPKLRTVRFTVPGMELDPGGIGKGFAVDDVVSLLRANGVMSALIDAGSSSIYALGAPPHERGWKVQIPRPEDHSKSISTVFLRDQSLSTSGNYEKFFRLNNHVYCHIMDPRTGEPVKGMLQTTVVTPRATDSDALSTAMFVMGPVEGAKLLRSVPGAEALWVMGYSETTHVVAWSWPARVLRATNVSGDIQSKYSGAGESKQGGNIR